MKCTLAELNGKYYGTKIIVDEKYSHLNRDVFQLGSVRIPKSVRPRTRHFSIFGWMPIFHVCRKLYLKIVFVLCVYTGPRGKIPKVFSRQQHRAFRLVISHRICSVIRVSSGQMVYLVFVIIRHGFDVLVQYVHLQRFDVGFERHLSNLISIHSLQTDKYCIRQSSVCDTFYLGT